MKIQFKYFNFNLWILIKLKNMYVNFLINLTKNEYFGLDGGIFCRTASKCIPKNFNQIDSYNLKCKFCVISPTICNQSKYIIDEKPLLNKLQLEFNFNPVMFDLITENQYKGNNGKIKTMKLLKDLINTEECPNLSKYYYSLLSRIRYEIDNLDRLMESVINDIRNNSWR